MKVIHHRDRPLLECPDESWRPSLRIAVTRFAGANRLGRTCEVVDEGYPFG